MKDLIFQLSNLRQQLIETVDKFLSLKREELIFDKWSLKDILAHLSGWDIFTTESIIKFINGKTPDWGGNINEFNKKSLLSRQNYSWSKIYKEFVDSSLKNIKAYQSINPSMFDKKIWPNKSYTPVKFIQIDIDHYREHLEKIKEKL